MKKYLFFILALSIFLSFPTTLYAQTATPKVKATPTLAEDTTTPSPSAQPSPKSKIDELKEKVANTVANLNLVSKKAMAGEIQKLEKNQLTIATHNGTQLIDLDELTKYAKVINSKRSDASFADLKIGDSILALGIYNKDSKKLAAKLVIKKDIVVHVSGLIKEVDIKANTITVEEKIIDPLTESSTQSKPFVLNSSKTTKFTMYSETQGLIKADISKTEINQRIIAFGTPLATDSATVAVDRVLLLPAAFSPTNAVITSTPSATPKPGPTTKPTPTLKPSPTTKPTPTKKPSTLPTQIP
jgi:hypothetical protein